MDLNDYGSIVLGLMGISAMAAYGAGIRHGRTEQFEVQTERRDEGIIL